MVVSFGDKQHLSFIEGGDDDDDVNNDGKTIVEEEEAVDER